MGSQNSSPKTENQKKLVALITNFVTKQIGSTENGKKYLRTLGEKDPQKALNKLGSTHAGIKKAVEELSPDSEQYNNKEYEVVQAIAVTLTAYNNSKKNEEVAIGVIASMSQQTSAPQANEPKESVSEASAPKGPGSRP